MPLLDVTDVLLDPDFMSTGLVCKRSTQTVGNDGIATLTTTTTPFAAVITNADGDMLQRLSDGERIKGSITVHTPFRLNDGSAGVTADVITWQGRDYTVASVADYSHFGRGFIAAECDLIPLSG